jgi:hypothetical protein
MANPNRNRNARLIAPVENEKHFKSFLSLKPFKPQIAREIFFKGTKNFFRFFFTFFFALLFAPDKF